MSLRGIENFRPNADGTFGPNHWTMRQLSTWVVEDMEKTYRKKLLVHIAGILMLIGLLLTWMVAK